MHTLSFIQTLSRSAYDLNSNFYKRKMNLLFEQICRKILAFRTPTLASPSVRCIFPEKIKLCNTNFSSQTPYQTFDQRQTFRINQNSNKIPSDRIASLEPSPPNHSHQQQGWFHFSNENEVKIMHDDELWVFFPAIFSLVVCQVMHSWCCHAATPSTRVNEQKIKLSNLIFYCLRMIWTFRPNNFK